MQTLLASSSTSARHTIRGLMRLGWLRGVGVRGAWAFLPPGVAELHDPYLALRGWRAVDVDADFALAGGSAAWHLGYLRRRPAVVSIWLSDKSALPPGLRGKFQIVTTAFPSTPSTKTSTALAPTPALLRKRKLDLTAWASRLPALGPEALLVQLAQRPASVDWTEFAPELAGVVDDADLDRTKLLLSASSDSAKQRAAFFFAHSQRIAEATALLPEKLHPVQLGRGGEGRWDKLTHVMDHLLTSRASAQDKT